MTVSTPSSCIVLACLPEGTCTRDSTGFKESSLPRSRPARTYVELVPVVVELVRTPRDGVVCWCDQQKHRVGRGVCGCERTAPR